MPKAALACLACTLLAVTPAVAAASWPDGKELTGHLIDLAAHERATLREIGRSAGDQKLRLLEIAPVAAGEGGGPAVLVLANCEGELPLASLAAVELATAVLEAAPDAAAAAVRWLVLPIASPDGLDRVFARPRAPGGYNATAVDLDGDGFEGEDPHEDLDGDGLITWMLVEDPAGAWALNEAGLPVEADPARGLAGRYRRESEGHDHDGDGRFNEDPPGGVDIARNFPHDFEPWTGRAGRWPGDQPETRAILEFAFSRQDIALVVVLGEASNLHRPPNGGNDRNDGKTPVKVPWRLASDLNLEANATYPLQAVLDAAAAHGQRQNLTPARVRAMLSLEPLRRPPTEDLPWWRALADHYQDHLKAGGQTAPRLSPTAPGPGSPAGWAYFQYGTPTIALDLWSLPLPADTTAVDTTGVTESVEDTVQVRGPQPAPEHVVLQQRTQQLGLPGWSPWTEVTLPDGKRAMVGGPLPGALHTPPAAEAETHARALLPFLLDLPAWLPELRLSEPVVRELGSGVVEVTVEVGNPGRLPYPTTMGTINRRPPPVTVTLAGAEPLQENLRQVVPQLPAGGAVTLRWLVRTGRPDRISITAAAPSLGTVTVTGGKR